MYNTDSTMASYFKQLSDDMERVAQVVEEGAKFMMGSSEHVGAADPGDDCGAGADPGGDMHDSGDPAGGEGDGLLDDLEDAVGGASPLMGMADSVMSDIMSSQVGALQLQFGACWAIPLSMPSYSCICTISTQ